MFCIECGEKLPESAKFCMGCGTKVGAGTDSTETREDTSQIQTKNTKRFQLLDYIIDIEAGMESYISIRNAFEQYAMESATQLNKDYFSKYKSADNFIRAVDNDVSDYFDGAYNQAVALLHNMNIYTVDYSSFKKYSVNYTGLWDETFNDFKEEYQEIVLAGKQEKEYRRARKATRGKLVGGGFGVGGAIKGMAMAGSVNAATGVLHSIGNSIGNASTNAAVSRELSKIYSDENLKNDFVGSLYQDLFNLHNALIDYINTVTQMNIPSNYSSRDYQEATLIYENIKKNSVREDMLKKAHLDMILKYPFELKFYLSALVQYGDENHELENYANFHGVSLSTYKEKLKNDSENLDRLKEQIGENVEHLNAFLVGNYFYEQLKYIMTNDLASNIRMAYNLSDKDYSSDKLFLIMDDISVDEKIAMKITNAKRSYAKISNEHCILLHDSTVFGGSEDGFIITNRNVYGKNIMEKPWQLPIQDIQSVTVESSRVRFNDVKAETTCFNSKVANEIQSFLEYVLANLICCEYSSGGEKKANTTDSQSVRLKNESKNYSEIDIETIRKQLFEKIANSGIREVIDQTYVVGFSKNFDKKLKNVSSHYLELMDKEEPILIYDDTVFGGSKEGFTLTNQRLQYHNSMEDSKRLSISDIVSIDIQKSNITINNSFKIDTTLIPKKYREDFLDILQSAIAYMM